MNKRGQGLVESKTLRLLLFLLVAVTLFLSFRNALDTEKFNELRGYDLALTLNSAFIPKGNLDLNHEIGGEKKEIIFDDNVVKTYIDDPIREGKGDILIGDNYQIKTQDLKTNSMAVSKKENRVEIG